MSEILFYLRTVNKLIKKKYFFLTPTELNMLRRMHESGMELNSMSHPTELETKPDYKLFHVPSSQRRITIKKTTASLTISSSNIGVQCTLPMSHLDKFMVFLQL